MATKQMKQLLELRGELEKEIRDAQQRLEGVKMAIAALEGHSVTTTKPRRAPRSNVKQCVLQMLSDAGGEGIQATEAVDIAEKRYGVHLERGSVSSLLSRLKRDGVVTYEDGLYKLRKIVGSDQQGQRTGIATSEPEEDKTKLAAIHTLRTSAG